MYDHEPSRTEPLAAALIQALTTEQQLPVTDVPLAPDQQLRSLLEQQFANTTVNAANNSETVTDTSSSDAISAALETTVTNPATQLSHKVIPMSTQTTNWKKLSAIIAASFAGVGIATALIWPALTPVREYGPRIAKSDIPQAAVDRSSSMGLPASDREDAIKFNTLDQPQMASNSEIDTTLTQPLALDSALNAPLSPGVVAGTTSATAGPPNGVQPTITKADPNSLHYRQTLSAHAGNASAPTGQPQPGQRQLATDYDRYGVANGGRYYNAEAGKAINNDFRETVDATKRNPADVTRSAIDSPAELETRAKIIKEQRAEIKQVDALYSLTDLENYRQYQHEQYEQLSENPFQPVKENPLSTFSIDVDTASYANCRRFLMSGQLPPPAAVRIEEFVNYFSYNYPQPSNGDPFSVQLEASACPWNEGNLLLHVGLKGKEIDRRERPASNLVFLVDVSGSMTDENKLPLLRAAMHQWTNELGPTDTVTIVTYAGASGLRLAPTKGNEKEAIHAAIETLQSGGSTNGSAGIELAYEKATEQFIKGGVNRILWATDGDLNVGVTSDDALVNLITDKAKSGVFMTVLGVGTGNLKDAKLEKMADKGNGIYAYLDTPKEARKVLIEQMSGSTITIAKDVKLQLEFNPAVIAGYRLIGYENRMLATQDFHDDKKDAGEIGAGHTVTAIYELIPTKSDAPAKIPGNNAGDPLKYQTEKKVDLELTPAAKTGELLTVKLRYKQPEASDSVLREYPLKSAGGKFTAASSDMQFACCVAQFGMWLRNSQYRGEMQPAGSWKLLRPMSAKTKNGSRKEFVELVKKAMELKK